NGPAFASGATAPFKYGTVDGLSGGATLTTPASGIRYTSYFLKVVDGGLNGYSDLEIDMLADDGAFIYINGIKVANDNVSGTDSYTRLSDDYGSESTWDALTINGSPMLNPGPNLLAISVHNQSTSSSDLGFGIRVRGVEMNSDIDGDGLPNAWELAHFGGITNAVSTANPDNDNYNNLQEYIAGLNPNVDDVFSIINFEANPQRRLEWDAISGRVYSVYWSSNLLSEFSTLQSNLTSGGYTDVSHSAEAQGFYQVEVELAP
ncbi:MAG: hypothetical protein OEL75_02110, partial [Kiritimatiellaceae bacterium]|nr:hypothetical protein [Kiritimatiellaceae bacterium]